MLEHTCLFFSAQAYVSKRERKHLFPQTLCSNQWSCCKQSFSFDKKCLIMAQLHIYEEGLGIECQPLQTQSFMLTQMLEPEMAQKGSVIFFNGPFKSLDKLENGLMTLYTASSFSIIDCQLVLYDVSFTFSVC